MNSLIQQLGRIGGGERWRPQVRLAVILAR